MTPPNGHNSDCEEKENPIVRQMRRKEDQEWSTWRGTISAAVKNQSESLKTLTNAFKTLQQTIETDLVKKQTEINDINKKIAWIYGYIAGSIAVSSFIAWVLSKLPH